MAIHLVNGIPTQVKEIPYDIASIDYKFQVKEQFLNTEAVDTSKTNAEKSGACYNVAYDNESITVVSNNVTISSAPNFTVAVGDLIRQGTFVTEITAITSQTQVTVADGSGLSAGSATITQAIHTEDLNAFGSASEKTRPIDVDSTNITQALLHYFDDTAEATGTDPNIAAVLSADGFTNQSAIYEKPELSDETVNSVSFGTPGTNLKIKFFSNITSGQGTVKLTAYKIAFQDK